MNTIAKLQEKPFRCALAVENELFPEEVRQLLHGKGKNKYRILFTVRQNIVSVLYVRHVSQAPMNEDDLLDNH